MKPVPRGGNAAHMPLRIEGAEMYKAIRFGRQFTIDLQDLENEDLDAIIAPFIILGRAAQKLKLDLVYAELMSNPTLGDDSVTLFHAASHGNLSTTVALAVATLDTAMKNMGVQRENNQPVNTPAKFLIVPPDLDGLARRLVKDMTADEPPLIVRPRAAAESRRDGPVFAFAAPDARAPPGRTTSFRAGVTDSRKQRLTPSFRDLDG